MLRDDAVQVPPDPPLPSKVAAPVAPSAAFMHPTTVRAGS